MKWVIDDFVARNRPVPSADVAGAARRAGLEVISTTFSPDFDPSVLPLAEGEDAVVRGTVGFLAAVRSAYCPVPGGFDEPGAFSWKATVDAYGPVMLSARSAVVSYDEFRTRRSEIEAEFGVEGRLFVKPALGGKRFNGFVLDAGAPLDDAHWRRFRKWSPLPDDEPITVATPRTVLREARFVIADGEIVAASLYSDAGSFAQGPAPDGMRSMAHEIASHVWTPARVFCADVAETPEGTALVETNCFGSSALYGCDPDAVVEAVMAVAHSCVIEKAVAVTAT